MALNYDVEYPKLQRKLRELKTALNTDQLDRIEQMLTEVLAKLNKPKRVNKAQKIAYTPAFEQAWKRYPKRSGGNSKAAAFQAWRGRTSEGETSFVRITGTGRYAEWCKATNKLNTEYVMMASTFFGPSKHYLEAWELPDTNRVPKDDAEALAWGEKRGIMAGVDEPWSAYRQRLEASLKEQPE